jgi:hypothetical protein
MFLSIIPNGGAGQKIPQVVMNWHLISRASISGVRIVADYLESQAALAFIDPIAHPSQARYSPVFVPA